MKLNKVKHEILNLIDKANKDGKFLTGDQLKTAVGEKRFTQRTGHLLDTLSALPRLRARI